MNKTKFPLGASTLAGLKGNQITDRGTVRFTFGLDGKIADGKNGFGTADDVTGVKVFRDGAYVSGCTEMDDTQDLKLEFYNGKSVRLVNLSGGLAFTLPVAEAETDYTISKYRARYAFGDSVLSVSVETQNPYNDDLNDKEMGREHPWYIYCAEWLIRFINNDDFIKNNGLTRLNGGKAYPLSESHEYGDLTVKEGYDVYRYDIKINDETGNVERPYYHVAVVREAKEFNNFALFVLKSATDQTKTLDTVVESVARFAPKGTEKNYFNAGKPRPNPKWTKETREYFDWLNKTDYVNWGVFSFSMPGEEYALHAGSERYDSYLETSRNSQRGIENIWGHKYDIFATYTHLSSQGTPHHFPTDMAKELAGGNGKNGKPVLQFTYQYTTDNNTVATMTTPMFDIMRGKYDGHFRRLARDIKEYGKTVLFRLNNEMSTDWTSYCGMMTLLDPDIFNLTWQRLYDIFEEENVDNVLWIWNPNGKTIPFCDWGENLCYFPGLEYVQLLGGTSYEFNNYPKELAAQKLRTFKTHYSELYEKNKPEFSEWSMIISESACGSGGDYTGELGRNASAQAEYVREMFRDLNAAEKAPWAKQIKGIVWFNCNDMEKVASGELKITNRLCFYLPENLTFNVHLYNYPHDYSDLKETHAAFREGFAQSHKK